MAIDFRKPITLGRTGLTVSRLGIGSSYGVPAHALERAFWEYGVNYFYWGAIRRGGMKVAIRNICMNERERMVIALQSYDRSGPLMKVTFERGLKALGIDHADVLILGWRDSYPARRIIEQALRLKERGLCRFIALSGHNRTFFRQLVESGETSPFDILMLRYNAAHRGAEKDIFPYLPEQRRPGLTIFTATRWGQLLKAKHMPPGEEPLTASQCYRFVLSHPASDICLCGPSNAEQMMEALKALEEGPLDEEEMARVRHIGAHIHGRKTGPFR